MGFLKTFELPPHLEIDLKSLDNDDEREAEGSEDEEVDE